MKQIPRVSCPFCGSLATEVKREQHYGRRVWIDCRLCQARGPVATTYNGASDEWNTRHAARLARSAVVLKFRRA